MKTSITPEEIEKLLSEAKIITTTIFDKVTVVHAKLASGFVITESVGAVNKKNYDEAFGREICINKIRDQLWLLEGYALQKTIHRGEPKHAT